MTLWFHTYISGAGSLIWGVRGYPQDSARVRPQIFRVLGAHEYPVFVHMGRRSVARADLALGIPVHHDGPRTRRWSTTATSLGVIGRLTHIVSFLVVGWPWLSLSFGVNPMPLYTIIADYAGGTYTAQHRASSPRAALAKWAQDSDSANYVHRRRRAAYKALQREFTGPDNLPVPVAGLVRVWCTSASVRGRLLLLHIVETHRTPNKNAR